MRTQQMLASKACKLVIRCWFGACYRSQGDVVAVYFVNKEFWLHCIIKGSDTLFIDPVNSALSVLLPSSRKVFGECRPPPSNEKESWIQIVNLEQHQHLEMSLITLSPYQHMLSTSANLLITFWVFRPRDKCRQKPNLLVGGRKQPTLKPRSVYLNRASPRGTSDPQQFEFSFWLCSNSYYYSFLFFCFLGWGYSLPIHAGLLTWICRTSIPWFVREELSTIYSTELPPHQSASTHPPPDKQEITRQAEGGYQLVH